MVLSFMNKDVSQDGPQLKPRECGYWNCNNKEEMSGDFNLCSKCHKQPYCGKNCQVKDWKIHKLLCGGKNKTNIEDETLLSVVEIVVNNHAATVDLRSKKKVSTRQKDAATASLLKKMMKMFLGEFSHFNSPSGCGDAGSDPAFSQALADFFSEQPGFEKVWGELRVGYKESLELGKEMERSSNGLTVDESFIRDKCETIARHFTASIGNVMCDGDSKKNLSKHSSLIDALVEHTKEFIKEHKEFDSCSGLQKLAENPEYLAGIGIVIGEIYECMEEVGDT